MHNNNVYNYAVKLAKGHFNFVCCFIDHTNQGFCTCEIGIKMTSSNVHAQAVQLRQTRQDGIHYLWIVEWTIVKRADQLL